MVMAEQVLVPLAGELHLCPVVDPEPDEPVLLFDIEIPVRIVLSSPVAPAFFHRPDRTTRVSLEDVDLGVADWHHLAGSDIVFPRDMAMDAAIYLATVHNPVKLRHICFGPAGESSIGATIDLEIDFCCVK